MLFRELIFLNYTNRPVQVTCPSLLFRTPMMFVSSTGILSNDFMSSNRSLTKSSQENWSKPVLSFSTPLETLPQKIAVYYSPLELFPNYRKLVAIPITLQLCRYLQKSSFCAVALPQLYTKAFRGETSNAGLAHPVLVVAPNLRWRQWEKNLIPHSVLTEASGKTDFSPSQSGLNLED